MEPLEERQMLSVNPLVSGNGSVGQDGPTDLSITFDMADKKTGVVGIQITATDGSSIDPAKVQVFKVTDGKLGDELAQLDGSLDNISSTNNGSIVYVSIAAGEYAIRVSGENDTYGSFKCDVFVPGSVLVSEGGEDEGNSTTILDGSGTIAQYIYLRQNISYNENALQFYNNTLAQYGTSFFNTKYDTYFDLNGDGKVSQSEVAMISANAAAKPGTITATLEADSSGPSATMDLKSPNEAAKAAGVTDDPIGSTVTISDPSGVKSAQIGFKDSTGTIQFVDVTISTSDPTKTVITLTSDLLKTMTGGPVDKTTGDLIPGTYTLYLTATDLKGNKSEAVEILTFSVVGERELQIGNNPEREMKEHDSGGFSAAVPITVKDADKVGGNGDKLIYSLVGTMDPGVGTVAFDEATGKFTYTPGKDINPGLTVGHNYGTEEDPVYEYTLTFTVRATDLVGNTKDAVITIKITPENDAPVGNDDLGADDEGIEHALSDGKTVEVDVLANDTDGDKYDTISIGDKITYNGIDYTFTNHEVKIPVENPGTKEVDYVTITRTYDKVVSSGGLTREGKLVVDFGTAFDYLAADEHGTFEFTYTVEDGQNASDTAKVLIDVIGKNDAPTATDIDLNTLADDPEVGFDLSVPADKEKLTTGKGIEIPWKDNVSDPDKGDAVTLKGIDGQLFSDENDWTIVIKNDNDNITCTFTFDENGKLWLKTEFASEAFDQVALSFTYDVVDTKDATAEAKITFDILGTLRHIVIEDDQELQVPLPATPDAETWYDAKTKLEFTPARESTYTFTVTTVNGATTLKDSFKILPDGTLQVKGSLPAGDYELAVTVVSNEMSEDSAEVTVKVLVAIFDADNYEDPDVKTLDPIDENGKIVDADVTDAWKPIAGDSGETWGIVDDTLELTGATGTPSGYDASKLVYSLDPATGKFSFDPGSVFFALGSGRSSTLTFTYKIKSSLFDEVRDATITFTINGVNNAPVAENYDFTGPVLEGDTTTGIHFNIGDFTISDIDDTDSVFTFASLGGKSPSNVNSDAVADRTVTFDDGSYAVFDEGGAGFTFFPSFGTSTEYYALRDGTKLAFSLDFTVTDGRDSSAAGTKINMEITGTNKTPTFKPDAPDEGRVRQNNTKMFIASAFASDPNTTDKLHFSTVSFQSEDETVTLESQTGGSFQEYPVLDGDGVRLGTIRLYDLDYSDPDKAGQIEFNADGVYDEGDELLFEFSFKVSDDSRAANNETETVFTYTLTIDAGTSPNSTYTAGCAEDGTVTQGPPDGDWEDTWVVDDDPASLTVDPEMTVSAFGKKTTAGKENVPSGYSAEIAADGTFKFNPNGAFDFLGEGQTATLTFKFKITDSETELEGEGTITLTVTGKNSAPVVTDYVPEGSIPIDDPDDEGITISIQDLITAGKIADTDRDDVFTFKSVYGQTINNSASDQRIDIYKDEKLQGWIIFAEGVNDSFTFYPASGSESYFYNLQQGAEGLCEFEYVVNDGTSDSTGAAKITVTVTGVNQTPTYKDNLVLSSEIKSGKTLELNPNNYAEDVNEGDKLYFTAVTFTSQGSPVTLNIASIATTRTILDAAGKSLGTITLYGTESEKPGYIEFVANGEYEPGQLLELSFSFKITDDAGQTNSVTADAKTYTLSINTGTEPSYSMKVEIDEDGTANQSPAAGTWDEDWTVVADSLVKPTEMAVSPYKDSYPGGDDVPVPSGFTAEILADGTFKFEPNGAFDFLGDGQTATLVFTYTINDSDFGGLTGTGTVTLVITGKNAAPVAANYGPIGPVSAGSVGGIEVDLATLIEGGFVSDADEYDTLSFASINGDQIVGEQTVVLENQGTLVFSSDATSFIFYPDDAGSFFYNLQQGVGLDCVFSYTVTDGDEESNEANITITVNGVNKPPTAKSAGDIAATAKGQTEGTSTTITPADWFSDVNTGDVLKFESITVTYNGNDTVLTQGTSATIGETIFKWNSDGTLNIDSTNAISLELGDTTEFTITATVMDYLNASAGTGLSDDPAQGTFTFTLAGKYDAPMAGDFDGEEYDAVAKASTDAGSAWSMTFGDFFDAIGLTGPDDGARTGTETIYVLGKDGTYHDLKTTTAGVELANGDYVFGVNNSGVWSIEYRAIGATSMALTGGTKVDATFGFRIYDDGEQVVAEDLTATLKVEGVNKAPVLDSASVSKTGSFIYAAGELATDPNGDTLSFATVTYTVGGSTVSVTQDSTPVTIAGYGTLTWYAATYTTDPTKAGKLEFTADTVDAEKNFTINFTVTDGALPSAEGTIAVKVDVVTVPKFDSEKAVVAGDYGKSLSWDIAGAFSGLGDNAAYEIVSINGQKVDGGTEYSSFLTQASLDKLALGNIDGLVELYLNAYSWNLQTSTITVEVKATGSNTESEGILGEFKIQPKVQHTVEYQLVVQQEPTANGSASKPEITTIPASEGEVSGSMYYLQLWVTDTSNSLVESGKASYGVEAVSFSMKYDPSLSSFDSALGEYGFQDETRPEGLQNAATVNIDGVDYIEIAWLWIPSSMDNPAPPLRGGSAVGIDRPWLMLQIPIDVLASGEQSFSIDEFVANSEIDTLLGYERWTLSDSLDGSRTVHPSQIKITSVSVYQESSNPLQPEGKKSDSEQSPLTAILGPEVAQEGGVYMRTVTGATNTDANGTVAALPNNADWIHEWQSHYVELWVKASEADKYTSAFTDLQYDTNYFTAVSVEYGPGFNGTAAAINDASGLVSGIGGKFDGDTTGDGYILLGRVRFESLGTDNVPWSVDATPNSLGLKILNPEVVSESGETISIAGRSSNTELWCNPYDSNDDGIINLHDVSKFIRSFGQKSTADNPLFNIFDFDKSGSINLSDCSILIRHFGVKRSDVVIGAKTLSFPAGFTQRYVGSTIKTDNVAMVGAMLDAANQAWADALGVDHITVQLAIKDYGDDSTLGEARIVELDAFGRPSKVIITLDDDGAGLGWYSRVGEPVAEGRYDLYTTLLHELGHAYGINTAYSAYNSVANQYGNALDKTGHATDADDVMFYGLNTGERKYLSELDINVVLTAYGAAAENNYLRTVDSKLASKLEAITETTFTVTMEMLPARALETVFPLILESAPETAEAQVLAPVTGTPALVPLGTAPVEAKSLAELQKVGLAVSVAQFKDMNREIKRDAFFAEIPKGDGFIDFEFLDSSEKREQNDKILEELLNEFELA